VSDDQLVRSERREQVTTLTMNRAARRNAFNPQMVDALTRSFLQLGRDDDVRVVVLQGDGEGFSAGADLEYMRAMGGFGVAENRVDAQKLSDLFTAIRGCPKPVVARVHGAAVGGGAGLVAAADIAIASSDAVFAFPEVRLGLVPAIVAPYVVSRVGGAAARRLFLTGAKVGAEYARDIGLVSEVVEPSELDKAVGDVVSALLQGGPQALAAVKQLIPFVERLPASARSDLADMLADLRGSEEGQEGIAAFLERRRPSWSGRKD
jgi:methylglutaconyl-CoA hydratase